MTIGPEPITITLRISRFKGILLSSHFFYGNFRTVLLYQNANTFSCGGKTNREICNELFISPHTVENYISLLYDKLSVNDREELIQKYSN
ncbi:MAG: response regulator transcription factor [Treponema sp.]